MRPDPDDSVQGEVVLVRIFKGVENAILQQAGGTVGERVFPSSDDESGFSERPDRRMRACADTLFPIVGGYLVSH